MKAVKTIDINELDKYVNDFFNTHINTSNSLIKSFCVTVNYFSIRIELTPNLTGQAEKILDNVYNMFKRDSEIIKLFLSTSDYIHYSLTCIQGKKLILIFSHDYKISL